MNSGNAKPFRSNKRNTDKRVTTAGLPDLSYITALCDLMESKKIDSIAIGEIVLHKSKHTVPEEKSKLFDTYEDQDRKMAEAWIASTKTD